MEQLFIYALKVNGSLLLFYLFYMLLYRRDTFLKIRRIYLLTAVVFSFIYPLLQFGEWFKQQKSVQFFATAINLDEIIITAQKVQPSIFSTENILLAVYVLVAFALLFKIILQIISIIVKTRKGEKTELNGIQLFHLNENITPFSFFNYIFINKNQHSEVELPEILTHELSHVRQRHSYDVVLSEITTALCWFNPFAWLLKKEIKQNLEYLADNHVINSGFETKKYQYLLLNISCNYVDNQLINQFNISPIKKRITMMNKPKTSVKGLIKYTLIVPVLLVMLIISNTQNVVAELQNSTQKKSTKLKKETVKFTAPKNQNLKKETVKFKAPEKQDDGTIVYEVTEVAPAFPGGQNGLMKYLTSSIKYPKIAIEKNIQGRVTIQFIVDETGKIIQPKVVKGVDPSLDAEAIRVVSAMPNWTPGKQKGENVKCKFFVPINFKLGEEKNEKATTSISKSREEYVMFYIDGKEVTEEEFEKLDNEEMKYINVLKPNEAIKLFGEKAKKGAIIFSNKKDEFDKYSDKSNGEKVSISVADVKPTLK